MKRPNTLSYRSTEAFIFTSPILARALHEDWDTLTCRRVNDRISICKQTGWLLTVHFPDKLRTEVVNVPLSYNCSYVLQSRLDKSNVVPLHAMGALWVRGGIATCHCFLASALEGGEWSASRPGLALPPEKEPPVPIVQEVGNLGSETACYGWRFYMSLPDSCWETAETCHELFPSSQFVIHKFPAIPY
jgi:hypothetical protein